MVETLGPVDIIKCTRNMKGLFDCTIRRVNSPTQIDYKDLTGISLRDKVTGDTTIVSENNIIDLDSPIKGSVAHYFPEDKKMVIEV